MIDESGSLSSGELAWSNDAWAQLFFSRHESAIGSRSDHRGWKSLTAVDPEMLGHMEDEVTYSRVTLTIGWCSELERLCVLAVEL